MQDASIAKLDVAPAARLNDSRRDREALDDLSNQRYDSPVAIDLTLPVRQISPLAFHMVAAEQTTSLPRVCSTVSACSPSTRRLISSTSMSEVETRHNAA